MINLRHYNEDSSSFFEKVVSNKRITKDDILYKDRLLALNTSIRTVFQGYDRGFLGNALESLICAGYTGQCKDDLLSLYAFKSKTLQDLKIKLTTTEFNRVVNTCQYCTIGEVNSFDHLIPQSEFPEFSVHPKNLFPCCSKCNGYKSTTWRENGKRLFLNLYLDQLPHQRYLFVRLKINGDNLETYFHLENSNGISAELYEMIEFHYWKLRLCERFSENIDSVVTPLVNSISSSRGNLSLTDIVSTSIDTSKRNMTSFGQNFWKSVLEIELLQDDAFLSRFKP